MMVKLGFSLEMEYDRPIPQVIGMLCREGFSAVSPVWGQDLQAIDAYVREYGMTVQSLHAPPKGMAALWELELPESQALQQEMLQSIESCARFGIPTLVVHGWQGHGYVFPDTPLDFTFWDGFVARAGELGVSIAFENLEGEEYLAALMERCRDLPHIGFCWDTGHDRCYPHTMDFLKHYGNRLMMTHINDNLGVRGDNYSSKDDLHLLPFDGNTDWQTQLGRMADARNQAILNFELKTRSHGISTYPQWTLEQFIREAAVRGRRLAEIYTNVITEKAP